MWPLSSFTFGKGGSSMDLSLITNRLLEAFKVALDYGEAKDDLMRGSST